MTKKRKRGAPIRGTGPLAAIRLKRGMSQDEAARRAGIRRGHLSNLEAGRHPDFTITTARRIARGWRASLTEVIAALEDASCTG